MTSHEQATEVADIRLATERQDAQQQQPPQERQSPTAADGDAPASAGAGVPRGQQPSSSNGSSAEDDGMSGSSTTTINSTGDAPSQEATPSQRDAGELKKLLETAGEAKERSSQLQDHRGAEHLALGLEVLESLSKALPLLNDKKLHGKATLLSVFQKCEDAVITATDDCSEDAAGCRKTLELAKGIVEGMLDHARLEEVRTSSCRGRLGRYIRDLDHFLQALIPQPSTGSAQTNSDVGGCGGEKRLAGGKSLRLPESGWGQEERMAMGRFCEERYMALQPYVSDLERVEEMRQYAEMALRERFREGRVLVFGSAASTLSVPESDIDLTLHLPSRVKLVQQLKDLVESRKEETLRIEQRSVDAVKLLQRRSNIQKKLSRLRGAVRERKNSLVDMSRSRDRIVERLHALKKASEAELEKKALLAQSA